ncbi:phage portal protein, PBSX family [Klebsiella pneumoniae]|uniref:Phage portal protein, PBSX family n=1 Tax=Klebsiella pneumoniae TaxID=573 RepID=A0A2X3FGI6_KLEPN|nr:phage portal protein, PBSX family [Klebsiella pneumoniae]
MPEYFAGLLSANLAHSADKFRKLYYDNGSHAGCIVYVNSAMADQESLDKLKKTLTDTRRGGHSKTFFFTPLTAAKTPCRSCRSARYRQRMNS